jgi:hypothetical protein
LHEDTRVQLKYQNPGNKIDEINKMNLRETNSELNYTTNKNQKKNPGRTLAALLHTGKWDGGGNGPRIGIPGIIIMIIFGLECREREGGTKTILSSSSAAKRKRQRHGIKRDQGQDLAVTHEAEEQEHKKRGGKRMFEQTKRESRVYYSNQSQSQPRKRSAAERRCCEVQPHQARGRSDSDETQSSPTPRHLRS